VPIEGQIFPVAFRGYDRKTVCPKFNLLARTLFHRARLGERCDVAVAVESVPQAGYSLDGTSRL
jgi:hypothetical protein